ncbi:AI-2E family transporter [Micromonospora sp. NPDC049559]|uniref:AI-2E family transporter n=1 Tax=Micromonospora sp. NPDC049559 TaxID=3155923 RepID=UPI00343A926D
MLGADDRVTARRVLISIGLLLATLLVLLFVYATQRILIWIIIAVFFAVALNPVVNWTQRHVVHRRTIATLLVFLAALVLLAALTAVIIIPLVDQASAAIANLPQLVREAPAGKGPIGHILQRLHLQRFIEAHQDQIRDNLSRLQQPTVNVLRGAVTSVAGTITVAVLAYLMVLQAPRFVENTLGLVNDERGRRLRRVGQECARTVTGYLSGNLLISLICGVLTFLTLAIAGVPYAGVIALLVAVADLLPLIGAAIGGAVAVGAGLIHSTRAGIIVLVFFILYQLFENHVLQPLILARTVRLSPLTVLVSVLLATELAGILGALLAIPAAGIIQIVYRELRYARGGPPDGVPPPPVRPPPASGEP